MPLYRWTTTRNLPLWARRYRHVVTFPWFQGNLQPKPVTSAPSATSVDRRQIDHLHALLESHSNIAYRCISKLPPSQHQSASPSSPNPGPQVHLPTRSIMASKCISQLTPFHPANAFPTSVDHSLWVIILVYLMIMIQHTSNRSQALPAGSPDMPCVGG